MEYLKTYGAAIGVAIAFIFYVGMVIGTGARIASIGAGASDTSSYSTTIPVSVLLSGIVMGLMMGLYAYSTINSQLVFAVSIVFSCFALGLSFSALGLAAVTH